MRRNAKGLWPLFLILVVGLIVGGFYWYGNNVMLDKGVAVTPYVEANGVNVIIVSNPYAATNYAAIVKSVKKAIQEGGQNASIVVVTGVYTPEQGNQLGNLFAGLCQTGAAGVYAYPSNLSEVNLDGVKNLHGATDTITLRAGAASSKSVELQQRARMLDTKKIADENTSMTLQIWDVESFSRRDIELSDAKLKVLVGSIDANQIGCDVYVYTGTVDKGDSSGGVMSTFSGVTGGETSYNYESSASRLLVHCGTAGALPTDTGATRHAIGVVEIASKDEGMGVSQSNGN